MRDTRFPASSRAGMTLLELVTCVLLTMLLLGSVSGLVRQSVRYHMRLARDLAQLQELSLALDRLKCAIREAREVRVGDADGGGADRLVLLGDRGERTEFRIAEGRLVARCGAGADWPEALERESPLRLSLTYEDTPWAFHGFVNVVLEADREERPPLRLMSAAAVRPRQ